MSYPPELPKGKKQLPPTPQKANPGTGRKLPEPPQKTNPSTGTSTESALPQAPAEAKKRVLPKRPQRSASAAAALSTLTSLREERINSDLSKIETLSQLYAHIANLTVESVRNIVVINYHEIPLYKKIDDLISFLKISQQFSVEILLDSKDSCKRLYECISNILSDNFSVEHQKNYQSINIIENGVVQLEDITFQPYNISLLRIQDILFFLKDKEGYKERKNLSLSRSIVFCILQLQSRIEDFIDSLRSIENFNKSKEMFEKIFWNHLGGATISQPSSMPEVNVFNIEPPDEELEAFLSIEEISTNNILGLDDLFYALKKDFQQDVHTSTSINFSTISLKLNELWSFLSASQNSVPIMIKTKIERLFSSKISLQEKKPSAQHKICINQNGAMTFRDALAILSYVAKGGQFQQGNGLLFTVKLKELISALMLSINAVVELRKDAFSTAELIKIVTEDLYQTVDIALNGMAGNNEPFYYFTNPAPINREPREHFVRRSGAPLEVGQPAENTRQLPDWMRPKQKRNAENAYNSPKLHGVPQSASSMFDPITNEDRRSVSPAASTVSTELEFEAEMPEADPFDFYPRLDDEDYSGQLHVQPYALKAFYYFSKHNNFIINDENHEVYAQKAELIIPLLEKLLNEIEGCQNIVLAKFQYKEILRTLSKLAQFKNIRRVGEKNEIILNFKVNITLENMRDVFFLLDGGSDIEESSFKIFISNSRMRIKALHNKLLEVHVASLDNSVSIQDLCTVQIEPLLSQRANGFYTLRIKNGDKVRIVSQERLLSRARIGDTSATMAKPPRQPSPSYFQDEWSDFSDDDFSEQSDDRLGSRLSFRPSSAVPMGSQNRGYRVRLNIGQYNGEPGSEAALRPHSAPIYSPYVENLFDLLSYLDNVNPMMLHRVHVEGLLKRLTQVFNYYTHLKSAGILAQTSFEKLCNVIGISINYLHLQVDQNVYMIINSHDSVLSTACEVLAYKLCGYPFFRPEIAETFFTMKLLDALSDLIYRIEIAQQNPAEMESLRLKLDQYFGNTDIQFVDLHKQALEPLTVSNARAVKANTRQASSYYIGPDFDDDVDFFEDLYQEPEWNFDVTNKAKRKHLYRLRRQKRKMRFNLASPLAPEKDIRVMTSHEIDQEIAKIDDELKGHGEQALQEINVPVLIREASPRVLTPQQQYQAQLSPIHGVSHHSTPTSTLGAIPRSNSVSPEPPPKWKPPVKSQTPSPEQHFSPIHAASHHSTPTRIPSAIPSSSSSSSGSTSPVPVKPSPIDDWNPFADMTDNPYAHKSPTPPPLPKRVYDPKNLPGPPPRATNSSSPGATDMNYQFGIQTLKSFGAPVDPFADDEAMEAEMRQHIEAFKLLDAQGQAARDSRISGQQRPRAVVPAPAPFVPSQHDVTFPRMESRGLPVNVSAARRQSPPQVVEPVFSQQAGGTTMNMLVFVGSRDTGNHIKSVLESLLVGLPVSVIIWIDPLDTKHQKETSKDAVRRMEDFRMQLSRINDVLKLRVVFLCRSNQLPLSRTLGEPYEVHPFERDYDPLNVEDTIKKTNVINFKSAGGSGNVPEIYPQFLSGVKIAKQTLEKKEKSFVEKLFSRDPPPLALFKAYLEESSPGECFISTRPMLYEKIKDIRKTTVVNIIKYLEIEMRVSSGDGEAMSMLSKGFYFFKQQENQDYAKKTDAAEVDFKFFEKKIAQLGAELTRTTNPTQIAELQSRIQKLDEIVQYSSRILK